MDDTKKFVENLIHKMSRDQYEQIVSFADLLNIKNSMEELKSVYLHMIMDRYMAV